MYLRSQMAKTILLAGIPLLTLPLLAESGMSGEDRAQSQDRGRSNTTQQIIEGVISKKNAEEITLRTSDGKRITFRINDQTNELCPEGTQTSQKSSMTQGSTGNQDSATGQTNSTQNSSGQSTPGQNQMAKDHSGGDSSTSGQTSSSSLFGIPSGQASGQNTSGNQNDSQQSQQQGFRFGDCNFQKGEFVKAKIDENKTATFVRSMGDSEEYHGTGGVEGEYFVLPAGQLGGLDISDKDVNYSVKSSDGKEIGSVYRVMTNNNGDMSYAIIRKADGQLISVPWQALEGAGNKSFKMKVTQNQLGNLPILNEGENAGAHVQKHWNLTEQERKNLAKWNERTDERDQVRDRYYEDTPTFPNNREGYDRYDSNNQSSSGMNRSRADRQRGYQDQNRQGQSSGNYQNRGNQQSSRSQDRGFNNYGDQYGRGESSSNRRNYDDSQNSGNQRSMYSQSPERNYRGSSDRYNTTAPRSDYDSQREGDNRDQASRSRGSDYDYRPDGYRP